MAGSTVVYKEFMNQLPNNPEQDPSQSQPQSWLPQDGVAPAYLQQQYQPAWQMPGNPNTPPKNTKVIVIVLGAVVSLVFLLIIVGFTFFNSLASSEAKKIDHMKSIANRIVPGEDWSETYSMDPKVDPTCIPSNVSCHRLQRMWEMPETVSIAELESMLQVTFEKGESWRGCSIAKEDGLRIELCVPDSNTPQVNLSIQD